MFVNDNHYGIGTDINYPLDRRNLFTNMYLLAYYAGLETENTKTWTL